MADLAGGEEAGIPWKASSEAAAAELTNKQPLRSCKSQPLKPCKPHLLLLSTRFGSPLKLQTPGGLEHLLVAHYTHLVKVVLIPGEGEALHVVEPVITQPQQLQQLLEQAQQKVQRGAGSGQGTNLAPVRVSDIWGCGRMVMNLDCFLGIWIYMGG